MEIVIKIDDYIAQGIIDGEKDAPRNIVRAFQETIADAIKNGTPLPKGHGKLGDLDALKVLCTEHEICNNALDGEPRIEDGYYPDGDCIWKPLFGVVETIIPASTEE